jgi:hypothetical protein
LRPAVHAPNTPRAPPRQDQDSPQPHEKLRFLLLSGFANANLKVVTSPHPSLVKTFEIPTLRDSHPLAVKIASLRYQVQNACCGRDELSAIAAVLNKRTRRNFSAIARSFIVRKVTLSTESEVDAMRQGLPVGPAMIILIHISIDPP